MQKPPDPAQPKRPPPLVQGSLEIAYGWEPFAAVLPELKPLWAQHWDEIGTEKETVPLDPDWDRYFTMARMGQLRVWTARTAKGVLVGYCIWIVFPALHYVSTLWAITDVFWVHPGYREGRVGVNLFTSCLPALKALGVKVADFGVKDTFQTDPQTGRGRAGKIFTRVLGCYPVNSTYRKVL